MALGEYFFALFAWLPNSLIIAFAAFFALLLGVMVLKVWALIMELIPFA